MRKVRYIGPLRELWRRTAIAQEGPFRVQFDGNEDWRLPKEDKFKHPETGELLCHDWHEFPREHFELVDAKRFEMRHLIWGNVREFTEDHAPDWLTSCKTVPGSTMDMRWFWHDHVLTLPLGGSVNTDFNRIRRIA